MSTRSAPVPRSDDDGGGTSAENLGTALSVVCQDDGICNYVPNAGAATPGTLAAFDGQNGAGSWQVCVGDSAGGGPKQRLASAVLKPASRVASRKAAPRSAALSNTSRSDERFTGSPKRKWIAASSRASTLL